MPYREADPSLYSPSDPDEDFAPAGYTLMYEEDWSHFSYNAGGLVAEWLPYYWDTGRFHNDEAQIFVDPLYQGTTGSPLGLDPFVVSGSPATLKITLDALTSGQQANMPNNPTTGQKPVYYSGAIISDNFFNERRGYWAIRVRCTNAVGLWPSFWLLNYNPGIERYEEVDVFESLIPELVDSSVHIGNPDFDSLVSYKPNVWLDKSEWHVYSARLTDVGIAVSINGRDTNRVIHAVNHALHMRLNLAALPTTWAAVPPEDLPAVLEVAWIRWYAPTVAFQEPWFGANGAAWNATRWPSIQVTGASTVTIQNNRGGRMAPGGAAYVYCRALSSASVANFDLTVHFTLGSTLEQYHKLNFRVSGGWSLANANDPVDGYCVEIFGGAGTLRYQEVTASVRGTPTDVARAWDSAAQWALRVQCIGSAIKIKAWRSASVAEPAAWAIEVTDATHASGGISLASVNGNATTATPIRWERLRVSTL